MGAAIQSGTGTATRHVPVVGVPSLARQMAEELLSFLRDPARSAPDQYEVVDTRLLALKGLARLIDEQFSGMTDELRSIQQWFREETNPVFLTSGLFQRVRTWPHGYPGDYVTLEEIYRNSPGFVGVGAHLDRYLLSRTLPVAVRSRMRILSRLLRERAAVEGASGNWLNLGCGSCRELLALEDDGAKRTIQCVDLDQRALDYSKRLLAGKNAGVLRFLPENALRFSRAERNLQRFGAFSTIYSAALFDYLESGTLVRLLNGLYRSLRDGGILIAPFKDKTRYETYDYHWLSQWHFFLQRGEEEYREVLAKAGIPERGVRIERDDTGVILFVLISKSAAGRAPQETGPSAAETESPGTVWRVDRGNRPNEESRGDSHEEDQRILGLLDQMIATAKQVNGSISNLCSRTAHLHAQCVSVLSESPE